MLLCNKIYYIINKNICPWLNQRIERQRAIKKRMDDGAVVNRRAGSGRKTVVDRDSLQDAIRRTAYGVPFKRQQSFDHCLHICWHLCHCPYASWLRKQLCETDWVYDLTHFVSRMRKCRNFHWIISLRSHFEIYNNNKSFSSMLQPQRIGWIKQKPDNNCQKQPEL